MGQRSRKSGVLRAFCEGWDSRILIQTFAYPTLCKERKGWGTRRLVALPALPNMNRELVSFQSLLASPTRRGMKRLCFFSESRTRSTGRRSVQEFPHLAKKPRDMGHPNWWLGKEALGQVRLIDQLLIH
jgi:hypothetical protein